MTADAWDIIARLNRMRQRHGISPWEPSPLALRGTGKEVTHTLSKQWAGGGGVDGPAANPNTHRSCGVEGHARKNLQEGAPVSGNKVVKSATVAEDVRSGVTSPA